jgi:hypothetical protein
MDYTKSLTEIKKDFNKLVAQYQWDELIFLQLKIKQGVTNLQPIYEELVVCYAEKSGNSTKGIKGVIDWCSR